MDNARDEKSAAYGVLSTTVLKPVCHQGTFVSYETQFTLTKRVYGRSRTDQLEDAVRDITEKTLTYTDNDVVKVTLEVCQMSFVAAGLQDNFAGSQGWHRSLGALQENQ